MFEQEARRLCSFDKPLSALGRIHGSGGIANNYCDVEKSKPGCLISKEKTSFKALPVKCSLCRE